MTFPITDLLSDAESVKWLEQHFHPNGFGCARCGAAVARRWRGGGAVQGVPPLVANHSAYTGAN
ncbi:MAG: hypothetical protein M3347_16790 [Armatimonadota bacterium]|nr:hypothetical protein [Armatimonadota bacterium]